MGGLSASPVLSHYELVVPVYLKQKNHSTYGPAVVPHLFFHDLPYPGDPAAYCLLTEAKGLGDLPKEPSFAMKLKNFFKFLEIFTKSVLTLPHSDVPKIRIDGIATFSHYS